MSWLSDSLFGKKEEPKQKLLPSESWRPSDEDLALARASGFGYGTGKERYFEPDQPVVDVTREFNEAAKDSPELSKFYERIKPAKGRRKKQGKSEADMQLEAALMVNRLPVAALGLDPRVVRRALGDFTLQGFYRLNEDDITLSGRDPALTLSHEATHRGLRKLRDSGSKNAENMTGGTMRFAEEKLVRQLTDQVFGSDDLSDYYAQTRDENPLEARANALEQLKNNPLIEKLLWDAARKIARQRPGGPR